MVLFSIGLIAPAWRIILIVVVRNSREFEMTTAASPADVARKFGKHRDARGRDRTLTIYGVGAEGCFDLLAGQGLIGHDQADLPRVQTELKRVLFVQAC